MIAKRLWVFALSFFLLTSSGISSFAQNLGPASSFAALRDLLDSAQPGDTILLSGDIASDGSPLTAPVSVRLSSMDGAVLRDLYLHDASVTFSDITLADTLTVSGTSHVTLSSGVHVSGKAGHAGLSFTGNGSLIVERGCEIEGGNGSGNASGAAGLSIDHTGGEFYGSIEGRVQGGSGSSGGAGMIVSPLSNGGAVMVSGTILGGDGASLGGHALNLYDLSGNAYITVDGHLRGGSGSIGGDGVQVVSASDNVNVGIGGMVKGGLGESYGGNALILLSAEGASSIHLSGYFAGGDTSGADAQPGTSLQLVGDSASMRARVDNCILEDGRQLLPPSTPAPRPERLPEETESVDSTAEPEATPEPSVDPEADITLDPTAESEMEASPESTAEPEIETTPEPTATPVLTEEPPPNATPSEAEPDESPTA